HLCASLRRNAALRLHHDHLRSIRSHPPSSTLFPYTTLFRSPEWPSDDSSHSGGCWEEPGKQNPRSCRAQELARSRAQENERQKRDRKSTRLNSSHVAISYAVFCLEKKKHDRIHATDAAGRLT